MRNYIWVIAFIHYMFVATLMWTVSKIWYWIFSFSNSLEMAEKGFCTVEAALMQDSPGDADSPWFALHGDDFDIIEDEVVYTEIT